ncbi:MAG: hypothetical protein K8R23_16385 [Chthoniobacter sp.]|nr:hypothetical protein [Chthoniobacter sp.]
MNAKLFFVPALGVSALLAVLLSPPPLRGEGGADDAVVTALLSEVATQQATISENQAKIDTKLATIAESVRVARIFVSRGGGKTK